jgi:hypothetical protein
MTNMKKDDLPNLRLGRSGKSRISELEARTNKLRTIDPYGKKTLGDWQTLGHRTPTFSPKE